MAQLSKCSWMACSRLRIEREWPGTLERGLERNINFLCPVTFHFARASVPSIRKDTNFATLTKWRKHTLWRHANLYHPFPAASSAVSLVSFSSWAKSWTLSSCKGRKKIKHLDAKLLQRTKNNWTPGRARIEKLVPKTPFDSETWKMFWNVYLINLTKNQTKNSTSALNCFHRVMNDLGLFEGHLWKYSSFRWLDSTLTFRQNVISISRLF